MPDVASPLSVEEVTRVADLPRYRDEWRDLLARSDSALLFQTYEFVTTWLEHFWQGKALVFLFVRRDGRLVALAPLLADDAGRFCCPGSTVLPGDDDFAIRADFLYSGDPTEVLDAVVRHLRSTREGVRLTLKHVPLSSPLLKGLPAVASQHGLAMFTREAWTSPVVCFQGNWEAYLRSRPSDFRTELRRKTRKIEAAGTVTYITASTPAECVGAFEDISVIETNCWKHSIGGSLTRRPRLEHFLRALAQCCAERGWLRLHFLCLDAKPIAHVYGFVFRNEYYAFHTSFDDSYRQLSPGAVLFGQALRDTCERGLRTFDFLGGQERWKREMTTDVRLHVDVCLFSQDQFRCRLTKQYQGRVKPFIETKLPFLMRVERQLERVVSLLFRVKRRLKRAVSR